MACYHPLKGFIIHNHFTENGKQLYKVRSYSLPFIEYDGVIYDEFIPIPCGQCVGCRLEYSRQWAIRCMLESEYHTDNYFITLTYDNEHVPRAVDRDGNGFVPERLTLRKTDLPQFCKKLRAALSRRGKPSFRFYSCGEYGSESARPHYHMIAFGLELDDLVEEETLKNGFKLYSSKLLSDTWGKGRVRIGSVTFESCAYVARYIMKKNKGKSSVIYDKLCIEPEFVNMSRRPGIGRDYFGDNLFDIYPRDSIVLEGGKLVRPPRYFDRLMDSFDESLMSSIKDSRKVNADLITQLKLARTDMTYENMLVAEENNVSARISSLVRPLD